MEETNRLQTIFDENAEKQKKKNESFWKVSYVNVQSLNAHKEYVAKDNFMMNTDIFALGETWLAPGMEDHTVFPDYKGHFASHGRGKGIAVFSRKEESIPCDLVHSTSSNTFSGLHVRTPKFDAVFLYLSADCSKD